MDGNNIDALIVEGHEKASTPLLTFGYVNHRGEYAVRQVYPLRVVFCSTAWHPTKQWMMHAYDVEKKATRTFALADFRPVGRIAPLSRDAITEALSTLTTIKQGVAGLPYRDAVKVHRLIDELHDTIGSTLPGGLAGYCEMSGEPLGHDEVAYTDPEHGSIYSAEAFEEMRLSVAADDAAAKAAVEGGDAGELRLSLGKSYRDRLGTKIGPMNLTSGRHTLRESHPFECFGRLYQPNGRYVSDEAESPHDLVSEA